MAATYGTKDIRNVAIVGHGGCGKTTLVERILEVTKTIGRMGSVQDKNTTCDYEPEEKEHQHSLKAAVVHADIQGRRVNILDTPGFPDFVGHAISALPAADTMLVVVDSTKGVENITRRMLKIGADEHFPRAIVINKIDHDVSKLDELVETLRATFGSECMPVNLPSTGGKSVISVLDKSDGEADIISVQDAHKMIIEQVVETDDALMERYLGGEEPSHEEMVRTFHKALHDGHVVPILFVSGKTGVGVQELIDFIIEYCPDPTEADQHQVIITKGTEESSFNPLPDPAKPFLAHVFRVTTDPFVGKLCVFRVLQGTLNAGDSVNVGDERKPVRFAHIFNVQGKDAKEIHTAIPGDIVGVAKIDEIHYNSLLHKAFPADSLRMRAIALPQPMFGLAVGAAKRGEEGKISQAIVKLLEEDPTLRLDRDKATHEMVIRGIGELHLRVVIEKIKHRFHLDVTTAPPKIAYKETISSKADGHHRHKKQTGGAGQFGEVYLRVVPLPAGHPEGFEFVDDTFGGSVPKQFMPAIEKGVRQVLETGAIAGYPLLNVRVEVFDGKYHPVDSKEVAFTTAGKRAFIDAVGKAKPIVLEPWVKMDIAVPDTYMGDITADLSGRRGRVQGTDIVAGGMAIITAVAPLSEVTTYASSLKAMTQGTGSYSMEYSHDEAAPPMKQAELVAAFKPHHEEE